jgi:hypothetical protein
MRDTGYKGPPVDCFAAGVCFLMLAAGGWPWDEAAPAPGYFERDEADPCFASVYQHQALGRAGL